MIVIKATDDDFFCFVNGYIEYYYNCHSHQGINHQILEKGEVEKV